ncbi:unnamed protein product, partial [marine sediment metagenome]
NTKGVVLRVDSYGNLGESIQPNDCRIWRMSTGNHHFDSCTQKKCFPTKYVDIIKNGQRVNVP